ncbi:hypothetical protein [Zavarzinia sp. CC-PAN008]|uniref:hypothetical protein n=1 Tax=Zavarzinia sp. CC-PAN008 TaxID=3243332 RepID=UPI003F7482C7
MTLSISPGGAGRRPVLVLALALASLAVVAPWASNGTVPVLCALVLAADRAALARAWSWVANPFGAALGLLGAWAIAAGTWSGEPAEGVQKAALMVVMWALGLVGLAAVAGLPGPARARLLSLLAGVAAVMIVLFLAEWATGGALLQAVRGTTEPTINSIGRGTVVLALLSFGLLGGVAWRLGRPWLALALGLAVGVTMLLLPMAAAALGWLAGLAIWPLAWAWPRATFLALRVLFAGLILAAPMIPLKLLNPQVLGHEGMLALPNISWQHRVLIWEFAAHRIAEKPIAGWGFDEARRIPGGQDRVTLYLPDGTVWPPGAPILPLHTHNGAIQVWLELGAVGAGLAAAIVCLLLGRLARLPDRAQRAAAAATATAFGAIFLVSFGAWQTWWQASGFLGAVAVVLMGAIPKQIQRA